MRAINFLSEKSQNQVEFEFDDFIFFLEFKEFQFIICGNFIFINNCSETLSSNGNRSNVISRNGICKWR